MDGLRVTPFSVGDVEIGRGKLAIIAGPCMAESYDLCLEVGETMARLCRERGFGYIFKASFDKANRTSASSVRGNGIEEGLDVIARVGVALGAPTTTDVHLPEQCALAARSID
ncbi:3-deoxy-8-phosphooctulonate synthase, partial [bacterium]